MTDTDAESITSAYIRDIRLKRLFVVLAVDFGVSYTPKSTPGYSILPGM